MKVKLFAACLFLLLTAASLSIMPTHAATEGHWITSYTVEDAQTGQKLIEADFALSDEPTVLSPVVSGAELVITFTVNVVVGGSGNLKLSSYMQKPSSGTYWELIPGDYDLGAGFTPNAASFEFNWQKGTFEMIAYGQAKKVTAAAINSTLIQLSGATGDVLDAIKVDILTAGASDFQNLYNQKEAKLQSLIDSGVDAGYITLYGNMLNQSKALVNKGYVNEAIALLNAIPSSGEPMGSALQMIMIPAIGVAAAGAVVFAFLFLRARGKNSYTQMVIEDQIKDLEGLTLRASKIDRTIASNLETVKDRLKRLVGM
ncbi:hypothetical protein G4O51_04710 [Candidatus Bathyarchaeota archaeon A05DMB-2]|jgi:hypothetical protein|nr:hypothetical protein [Candidatus Bathyarchaeota archaeon A05DMB-2]